MNRVHLYLLDSILVFAILLYINFTSAALARKGILLAVALLTVAAVSYTHLTLPTKA